MMPVPELDEPTDIPEKRQLLRFLSLHIWPHAELRGQVLFTVPNWVTTILILPMDQDLFTSTTTGRLLLNDRKEPFFDLAEEDL